MVPVIYDTKATLFYPILEFEHYLLLLKEDKATGKMLEGFASLEGKILVPPHFDKVALSISELRKYTTSETLSAKIPITCSSASIIKIRENNFKAFAFFFDIHTTNVRCCGNII